MDSKLLEKIEVVVFWILSVVFVLAAMSNFAYGQIVFGWFGLAVALGLFPPCKFPIIVKLMALGIAGLLIFI